MPLSSTTNRTDAIGKKSSGEGHKTERVPGEWPLLALARFWLASVVAANHYFFVAPLGERLPGIIHVLRLFGGTTAVIGFFLISGYSIAASLERNSTNFYRRRFIRLAPVYYVCLAYSVFPLLVAPHGILHTFPGIVYPPPSSPLLFSVIGALMAMPMLLTPIWVTFGVVWSLTCEIFYYAFAVRLAAARTAIPLSIAAASLTCYALMGQAHYPTLPEAVSIVCLWWIWLTGFLYHRHRNSAGAGILLAAGAFLSIAINPAMPERLAPFCICGTVLALWGAPRISLSRRTAGLFLKLGDISYPLYLSHVTTYFLLYHWFPRWFPAHSFFYYPIAVSVAALIQTYIEHPIQRRFRGAS